MSRRASRFVPTARRTVSRRPRIEILESRDLPTAFSVTSVADSGPGSLRAAIIALNADTTSGADSISFNIGGGGVQTISPLSALPTIGREVAVDATSQPGYAGTPLVVLDGSKAGAGSNGLVFGGGTGSLVRGLSIVNFTGGASAILLGGSSSHTTVEGNYLGMMADGQTIGPNSNGLAVTTSGNLIGMAGPANANLISGNIISGVLIVGAAAKQNLVVNNLIGTDKSGFFASGSQQYGVILAGPDNTVGGLTSASRNLISGNLGPTHQNGVGVIFQGLSTGNLVEGNLIGTDISAGTGSGTTAAVPNVYGVYFGTPGGSALDNVTTDTVGGTVSGAGNIISGNVVGITGNATTALIAGNTIGLAGPGSTLAIPNGAGILLGAVSSTIGGTAAAARNVISASSGTNNASGIGLELAGDSDLVQGNLIGADVASAGALTANPALRNLTGVSLHTTNSTIGGSATGAGNVISGNAGDGLVLDNGVGNVIQGNSIGLTPDLQGPLPNGGSGIALKLTTPAIPPTQPLALNDTIGGAFTGQGNTIANSVGSNIIVRGTYPTGYTGLSIRGNSIYGNQLPGIDLAGNGVPTPPPLYITQVNLVNQQNVVTGYFQGRPSTSYTVDVFGIDAAAPIATSNDGPGQHFLGSGTVTTDGSGIGHFTSASSATAFPAYTATLTGPDGTTTEFSQNYPPSPTGPQADLVVAAFSPSTTVPVGGRVTLVETVTNHGPSPVNDVRLLDTMPVTLANVHATTGVGTASVDTGNVVTAVIGTLAPGQATTVTITGDAAQAGPLTDAPGVFSATTLDPDYSNNSATQTITISPNTNPPRADLAVSLASSPPFGMVGSDLTYTVTVTNNGPTTSTNAKVSDVLPGSVILLRSSSSQGASPTVNGSTITANLGTIASGATATLTLVVRPTVDGTFTDTANVSGSEFDPSVANNMTRLDTVVSSAGTDLAITQVASVATGIAGVNFTYTITVTNNGPGPSSNATITDVVPASVTPHSANASQGSIPTLSGSTITSKLGTIAPGATATLTIVVTPTVAGTITNTASIAGDQADPNTANNSSSLDTVIAAASADLAITQVASATTGKVGSELTYTVTVTNHGPSAATDVTVSDIVPASATLLGVRSSQGAIPTFVGAALSENFMSIAPGASATLMITVRPTAVGTIANTANVSGGQADPNPANNATSLETAVRNPDVNLQISTAISSMAGAVGTYQYFTLTVTNAGTDPVTNATIIDTIPRNALFVEAAPSQGAYGTPVNGVVTVDLGTIAPGGKATLSVILIFTTPGAVLNFAGVYTPDLPTVPAAFTYGGILAVPAPLGPAVTGVAGSGQNSQLAISFSSPLDAKTATNPANYVLIATGPRGRNRVIPIVAVNYNQVNSSVRIVPAAPLNATQTYQLTVVGVAPSGITDEQGRRLVGTSGGSPGTNFKVTFLAGKLPQV